jgi:hypothetical protein
MKIEISFVEANWGGGVPSRIVFLDITCMASQEVMENAGSWSRD